MEQKEKRYTVKWQPKDDIYGITFTGMTDEVDIFDYEDGKRFCASFVVENGRHHTITQHNADWLKIFDHARNEVICYPKKEDKEKAKSEKKKPTKIVFLGSLSMIHYMEVAADYLEGILDNVSIKIPKVHEEGTPAIDIYYEYIQPIEDADLIIVIPKQEKPAGSHTVEYEYGDTVTYEMALANYFHKPILVAPKNVMPEQEDLTFDDWFKKLNIAAENAFEGVFGC